MAWTALNEGAFSRRANECFVYSASADTKKAKEQFHGGSGFGFYTRPSFEGSSG